jgi:antitoxin ParD1/3/4
MGAIEKTTISLPGEMLAEIKAAVAAGDYANASEVVRDALRQWQRSRTVIALNDDELRRLVEEGRASGAPVDGEQALTALQAKYEAMVGGKSE